MDATAQYGATMATVLGDLESRYTAGLARLSGKWSLDSDTKAQAVAAFQGSIRNAINTLDRMQADVIAGRKAFATWKALAESVFNDMNFHLQVSEQWGLASVMADTIRKTAKDVETLAGDAVDTAKKAVGGAADLIPFLAVGLVALVVLRFQR